MIFSNKADTLANLNKLGLKNSVIPRFVSFSVKEWKNIKQKKNIIENIKQLNSRLLVILRSLTSSTADIKAVFR